MIRRLLFALAVMASLSIVATPVLGATTYHIREQGSGLFARFTNLPDEWEDLQPGDYFETFVDAAAYLASGAEGFQAQYVCAWHFEFSILDGGEWQDGFGVFTCGEADSLSIDSRLGSGHVAATLPVEECLVWDEETGECLEVAILGELEIDLTLTGEGTIQRHHGTSSGGAAGSSQYAFHGTGSSRSAVPSGDVSLDGASLVDGATNVDGALFQTRSGWVEVYH